MLSETSLRIFYWGVYIWFAIGVATIAIPAIHELYKMFSGQSGKTKTNS